MTGGESQRHEPRRDEPLLRVDGLTVSFADGAVTAAQDVTFDVRPGERVAVVGESGSGKSATCTAIGGYVSDAGSSVTARALEFAGTDLTRRRTGRIPRRTPGISMVFQDAMTSLDAVWTVGAQLKHALAADPDVSRGQWRSAAAQWLRHVGLRDTDRVLRARPYELSGGMRQRVMLAIALCSRPRLLIADEPTSALDASLSQEVMELVVRLTDETGAALLVVSHDIRLCTEYTDRLVVMYRSRMVEDIAADRTAAAQHPYTRGLLACVPTLSDHSSDRLPTLAEMMREGEPVG